MPVYMLLANYLTVLRVDGHREPVAGGAFGLWHQLHHVGAGARADGPGRQRVRISQLRRTVGGGCRSVGGRYWARAGNNPQRGPDRRRVGSCAFRARVGGVRGIGGVCGRDVCRVFGRERLAHLLVTSPEHSTVYSFPPAGQLAHAMWVAMLVSVCYGMVGCALAAIAGSPACGESSSGCSSCTDSHA